MGKDKNENNAGAFVYKSVKITLEDGPNKGKSYEIGALIFGFTYYEDITKPFLSANLNINDSGMNLIGSGTGPITGGELVEITVEGPDNEEYTYNFRVYRVGDRIQSGKIQNYNLGLISEEALLDPLRLRKMGKSSFKIVREEINIEQMVRVFVKALNSLSPFSETSR